MKTKKTTKNPSTINSSTLVQVESTLNKFSQLEGLGDDLCDLEYAFDNLTDSVHDEGDTDEVRQGVGTFMYELKSARELIAERVDNMKMVDAWLSTLKVDTVSLCEMAKASAQTDGAHDEFFATRDAAEARKKTIEAVVAELKEQIDTLSWQKTPGPRSQQKLVNATAVKVLKNTIKSYNKELKTLAADVKMAKTKYNDVLKAAGRKPYTGKKGKRSSGGGRGGRKSKAGR